MLSSVSPQASVSSPIGRSTPATGATSTPKSQDDLGVRTACNFCRDKKIRCSKTSVEEGGCSRCKREGIECRYDVREPIGRPRKRKADDRSVAATLLNGQHGASTSTSARRMSSGSSYVYTPPIPSPSSYTRSPAVTSTTTRSPTSSSAAIDAPNLADLGLAAFLESLDTLEIKTEDGLTANMLAAMSAASTGAGSINANEADSLATTGIGGGGCCGGGGAQQGSVVDSTAALTAVPSESSAASHNWTASTHLSLANVFGSTSYAVPADLSWADPSWLDHFTRPSPGPRAPVSASSHEPIPSISRTPTLPPPPTTRVHCVPDPTGRGCTCLCDVSVALINVRTTLRQARGDELERDASLMTADCSPVDSLSSGSGGTAGNGARTKQAASTLQLTLSASQAVTAQCACSASCPTCRTDPSTSLSASLLVSTALQIYVRAVRTLRQGFGAPDSSRSVVAGEPSPHAHSAPGSEWDVSIGQYKPMATNARRIALFAMKLELRDLRDAIAKVSRAACGPAQQQNGMNNSCRTLEDEVNPIDRLVIRKLHSQLGDLLRTVEAIEDQQDAERNAISVESI